MISVAYITAPRPDPTLSRSVRSIRSAGYTGIVRVLSDGPIDAELDKDCHVTRNVPSLGNFHNWLRALSTLVDRTGDEFLIVCEDDVTWASGSFAALEAELPDLRRRDRFGMGSLYFPIRMARMAEGHRGVGSGELPGGWYADGMQIGFKMWGAQALVLSRAGAKRLMASSFMRAYVDNPRWHKNVDGIVSDVLLHLRRHIYWRVPCLVDHDMGRGNSSLGYPSDRPALETNYFTGEA